MPGQTIHSRLIVNAQILRMNPDNPDAEDEEIAKVERANIPDIAKALDGQFDHIKAAGESAHSLEQAAKSLPTDALSSAIRRTLSDGAIAGVNAVFKQLAGVGMGVNWNLANHSAAHWAEQFAHEVTYEISQTSADIIRRQLAHWIINGGSRHDLIAALTPTFGKERARTIAVTEATRAFTEGAFTTYEQAGFNRRPPEDSRPPAHPRCRCRPAVIKDNGMWYYIWLTAADEKVCPICSPRNETIIGVAAKG